jgi:ATP synthase protein I
MPDETEGPDRSGPSDEELDRRRQALERALAGRAQADARAARPGRADAGAGMAAALRLSSEFVAAILVGAAIGWLIDGLAGTTPWGMIVFLLLGFCAGILNVLRSAGLIAEQAAARDGAKAPDDE